jgi:RNA-binding protein 25
MDEMQSLAEEQRKAGMLLDDGAPVRLNVSIAPMGAPVKETAKEKTTVFAEEEEEEDALKKRRIPLVKLDFSVAESSEQVKERLLRIKDSVPHDKEALFKAKARWDGLNDVRVPFPVCRWC